MASLNSIKYVQKKIVPILHKFFFSENREHFPIKSVRPVLLCYQNQTKTLQEQKTTYQHLLGT
jgi:hypothetical protein